ncbi:hypothetical protein RCL_jg7916.t1 [Rhizophagus clarus]|uniref:Uncharacterized protein n=1 Tax=Rhizophagus clarus TaxID=94130 RepID=A0A8H3R6A5_9GLOM|nr:hypothetical protein RCL_jg7916.t1 [Rhizophagus clarus]
MSKQKSKPKTSKSDIEALEEAATIIQREETEKAKALVDQAASTYDEPDVSPIPFKENRNEKACPELVIDAQRTIQREEAKLHGGENPPDGAAAAAQSIASRRKSR